MNIRQFITVFTLWLCLATAHAGIADGIRFSHIGSEAGLSHSTVFDITQDREGNMWFATYDGLNKYDGYNFTVYRNNATDSCTIANDMINCVETDLSGYVWIGTQKGLSRYNHRLGTFANFCHTKNGRNMAVTDIVQISDTHLLLHTARTDELLLFDMANQTFVSTTRLPETLIKLRPTAMIRQNDRVYIGARDGLYIYTPATNTISKLIDHPEGWQIQTFLFQNPNKIWIATEGNGLYLYNSSTGQLKCYLHKDGRSGLNSDFVRSLAFDQNGYLWVGTYAGLNIYNEATDSFTSIKRSEIEESSLSQNSVRSIYKDSQGGMWLGTYWGGINYYHPLLNQFKRIKHVPSLNTISGNVITCIVEDRKQNLWIGTNDGGLNFYDIHTRRYTNYSFPSDKLNESFNDIKTVYVDEPHNKVYVGAHAGGMMVIDRNSGHIEYYNQRNSNLPDNNIYSILPDGYNGFYIAALEYLLHFNPATRNFTIIDSQHDDVHMRQKNRLLFRDSKQRVWAGGETGINIFRQQGTTLIPDNDYRLDPALKQAHVNCIYKSPTSNLLWIGVRNGLYALDDVNGTLRHYTTAQGLPSNVVYAIQEDRSGRLWISSGQGLSCMDPDSGQFRNYTVEDGLQDNQFNAGASCLTSDGSMLFGGVNGITSFCPETVVDNPYTPKPVINKLFVFNNEVRPGDESEILEQSMEYTDRITLSSSQNSFAVSFVVFNYISGRHNTFAYKLDGYKNEWYEQNDITPVNYANLPAGDYTFYVKAANNDGKWNNNPAVLHIRILPVWYRTWWAYLIFLAILSLIVYAVVRFFWIRKNMQTQILMERKDKERLEEINQMKIRFYVNISHELRTPLTLIIAPLQELLNRVTGIWERDHLQYIQRNTNRLLHLVNQLMDFRRAELGVFELRAVYSNAYKRVLDCFMNYESLSKRKEIDYNFYSELQDETVLFDENYLDLITNNLLSNAFKYTEMGESITVRLALDNGFLVLQVSDTGIGIPDDKQEKIFERFYQAENGQTGSGIGLSLVKRLVELHHGRIELKSKVGNGSVFTIYLPQDVSVYTPDELLGTSDGTSQERRVYSTNANDIYTDNTDTETIDSNGDMDMDEDADNNKNGTVLVVEDNKELRQYLVSGLSDSFNVLKAEDGQKALDILKTHEVDLILTDVMMPVMDGVRLCRNVKQNLRTCHIPVYMLSAKVDVKYQLDGLQVGADDYIAKPFSIEVLRAKITNMLRTRRRVFDRYSSMTEIEPEKLTSNAATEEMLRRAIAVVEKNMDNVDFSTEQFAREMNMSRSNLHLKLKAITGKSAIDFIHKIRFNKACQLLKEGKYSVSEISFMVGYNTPSYFAARFKKYVGCLPTEYVKK